MICPDFDNGEIDSRLDSHSMLLLLSVTGPEAVEELGDQRRAERLHLRIDRTRPPASEVRLELDWCCSLPWDFDSCFSLSVESPLRISNKRLSWPCCSAVLFRLSVADSRSDFTQDLLQLLQTSRLDQVVIEARLRRSFSVCILAVTSQCNQDDIFQD